MLTSPQEMGLTKSSEPFVSFTSFRELSCLSGSSLLPFVFFPSLHRKVLIQDSFTMFFSKRQDVPWLVSNPFSSHTYWKKLSCQQLRLISRETIREWRGGTLQKASYWIFHKKWSWECYWCKGEVRELTCLRELNAFKHSRCWYAASRTLLFQSAVYQCQTTCQGDLQECIQSITAMVGHLSASKSFVI